MLVNEIIEYFLPITDYCSWGGTIVDATVGFGGHSSALVESYYKSHDVSKSIYLHAIDADAEILPMAIERLSLLQKCYPKLHIEQHNEFFDTCFSHKKISDIDFVLMDLGVSMYHFKMARKGFSFSEESPLDMRLSSELDISAEDIINEYPQEELLRILYDYGEEYHALKWVNRIIEARKEMRITTSTELCNILQLGKKSQDFSVLARIFQALRIEVNSELERLQSALPEVWNGIKKGGRLAVISFHSLEDRIVKQFMRFLAGKAMPQVAYNKKSYRNKRINKNEKESIYNIDLYNTATLLTKKPIVASEQEIEQNSASRSAKLRIVEKNV